MSSIIALTDAAGRMDTRDLNVKSMLHSGYYYANLLYFSGHPEKSDLEFNQTLIWQ